MKKKSIITAALLAATLGTAATAQTPLRDQAEISEGLIAVGIAYEISEVCGSINARLVRGINTLHGLRNRARDLGYSEQQIRAFIDSKAEQDRLEGIARQRLAAMGAVAGNEASHCTVGQSEISKGSAIGRLLR